MAKAKRSKSAPTRSKDNIFTLRLLVEIGLALVFYPIALVLMWVNIAQRKDMTAIEKLVWAIVGLIWGFGPILYVLVGKGRFW